jgi:hypothetical protein
MQIFRAGRVLKTTAGKVEGRAEFGEGSESPFSLAVQSAFVRATHFGDCGAPRARPGKVWATARFPGLFWTAVVNNRLDSPKQFPLFCS